MGEEFLPLFSTGGIKPLISSFYLSLQDGGRLELCRYKPRIPWGYQKLEDARKDSLLEALKEAWLCQHIEFKIPGSKTEDKFMLFSSTQFVILRYVSPQKLIQLPSKT